MMETGPSPRGRPPPPPSPRKYSRASSLPSSSKPISSKSTYLMNNIPRGTPRITLINSLLAPRHEPDDPTNRAADVIFGLDMTDSRLDDELSVAVIEFSNTPRWLQQLNADPCGFPKDTSLGTLWRGVDISAVDEDGQTEFMRAVIAGGAKFLYAEMLAEFQTTDVNVQDNKGRTALHWACAATSPKKKLVALCLSVPDCQIGLRDNDGRTAFDIAMQAGNEKISSLFYRSIFEMEETDPHEALLRVLTITAEPEPDRPVFPGAALFAPVEGGNSLLVKALVERGVDLAATDTNGDTALHLAVKVCNVQIATMLLEGGSDAAAKDCEGRTAMQVAVENEQEDLVAMFKGHEVVLPAPEIDPKPPNQRWKKPLMQAANVGDLDAVCELLKLGADVNAKEDGHCALHVAAENGHVEIVKTLLAHGAHIEATIPFYRFTPLHLAAINGSTETVQVLLANGAYIEAVSRNLTFITFSTTPERTALQLASFYRHPDTVEILVAAGAHSTAVGRLGHAMLRKVKLKEKGK